MMVPSRWENGSEYSWLGTPSTQGTDHVPWDDDGSLLSSGRDALRIVLQFGVTKRGWRRLWVPEYFCQQVITSIGRPDLELLSYFDHPLLPVPQPPAARPGDAVLVVNYFGLRDGFPEPSANGVEVIEDHSHDPTSLWAQLSQADFCIASLRKTLPLTDGGVVWSPRGHVLPPVPPLSSQRRRAAALKLSAMLLKSMYLDGLEVDKATFLDLSLRGERALAYPTVSGISELSRAVVDAFDLRSWRDARRRNVDTLRNALDGAGWVDALGNPGDVVKAPFSAVLVVGDPDRRERLRNELLRNHVYPAVLWSLEQTVLPVGEEARSVSRRLLSVHCDGRYDAEDMTRIAKVVRQSG